MPNTERDNIARLENQLLVEPDPERWLVLSDCRLPNLDSREDFKNASIIIRDHEIFDIVEEKLKVPCQIKTLEAKGAYAIPGLMDMHVHLTRDPHKTPEESKIAADSLMLQQYHAERNSAQAVGSGITALRDVACNFNVLPYLCNLGHMPSRPHIFASGPMLTAPGGHGTEAWYNFGYEVNDIHEIEVAVERLITDGAKLIKIATAGFTLSKELDCEVIQAGVDKAHSLGCHVAIHALTSTNAIENAIQANADTIEHGLNLNDALLEQMIEKDIGLCPTLKISTMFLQDPSIVGGAGSAQYENACQIMDMHFNSFQKALSVGAKIIAGTDAGLLNMEFNTLLDELELMCHLGMKCIEALRSATIIPASIVKKKLGSLEPGAQADILLVENDPRSSIGALRTAKVVICDGKIVKASGP